MSRIVLHIDMDSFFASVEERDHPRLKGRPIVVGADPVDGRGRGVVSTANYAARKYGIKSAMPISKAWVLSQQAKRAGKPEAVFMEPNIRRYSEVSREIFGYIATLGQKFEQGGIDEAYLEIKNYELRSKNYEWERAEKIAKGIKKWVKEKQGLTCSVGIGPNKLIAKMAAQENKPDGLTVIKTEEVEKFLEPKSVRELPSIGPKAEIQLNRIGVKTISDLKKLSEERLQGEFGKWGISMYQKARGLDDSPVSNEQETKSIGEQLTFDRDTLDPTIILNEFSKLIESVHKSLLKEKFKFKTISVIVRFSSFITKTRAHTLKIATDDLEIFKTEAMKLLLPFLDSRENPHRMKLRLIGVRAEKLKNFAGNNGSSVI